MTRLACAALVAVTLAAAPPNPVSWKFEVTPAKPIRAGARFAVKLTAHIQDGWHFYSLTPVEDGPVPTRIWIAEGQPFQLAGPIKADPPESLQDETLHREVELYEGSASFTLPLRAAPGSPAGARTLTIDAQTQSCNNRMCLPPTTIKVEIPVTIGK